MYIGSSSRSKIYRRRTLLPAANTKCIIYCLAIVRVCLCASELKAKELEEGRLARRPCQGVGGKWHFHFFDVRGGGAAPIDLCFGYAAIFFFRRLSLLPFSASLRWVIHACRALSVGVWIGTFFLLVVSFIYEASWFFRERVGWRLFLECERRLELFWKVSWKMSWTRRIKYIYEVLYKYYYSRKCIIIKEFIMMNFSFKMWSYFERYEVLQTRKSYSLTTQKKIS